MKPKVLLIRLLVNLKKAGNYNWKCFVEQFVSKDDSLKKEDYL